jgi:hypothetical protein
VTTPHLRLTLLSSKNCRTASKTQVRIIEKGRSSSGKMFG